MSSSGAIEPDRIATMRASSRSRLSDEACGCGQAEICTRLETRRMMFSPVLQSGFETVNQLPSPKDVPLVPSEALFSASLDEARPDLQPCLVVSLKWS